MSQPQVYTTTSCDGCGVTLLCPGVKCGDIPEHLCEDCSNTSVSSSSQPVKCEDCNCEDTVVSSSLQAIEEEPCPDVTT